MRLVLDRSAEVCAWTVAQIAFMGGAPFPDSARGFGFERNGELIGSVVFGDYQPLYRTMQATFAATDPKWVTARTHLRWLFDYAFKTCGVQKLWSVTPASNERALRLARFLGLTPEATLKRQMGSEDAVFSSLFAEDYYGRACLQQTQTASAA